MDTYFEKGDTVLWALTPDGVVLHNFANRQYVELRGLEQIVWQYLDGTHGLAEVTSKVAAASCRQDGVVTVPGRVVEEVVARLLAGDFITDRTNSGTCE